MRYKSPARKCEFSGCDRPHKAKGYCRSHWEQSKRGSVLHEIRPCRYRGNPRYEKCGVDGCAAAPVGKGFCYTHYYVLYKHGLDPKTFDRIVKAQGGGCAICGGADTRKGMRLSVDHCHKSGAFRGALCTNCNQGLGKFFDRVELLERAIAYLTREVRKVA
jgi:hypothetical protein